MQENIPRQRGSTKIQSAEGAGRAKLPWQGPAKPEALPREETILLSSRATPSSGTSVWSSALSRKMRSVQKALGYRGDHARTARSEARRPLRLWPLPEFLGSQYGNGGNSVCEGLGVGGVWGDW